jgi:two-component system sensor histidine kinase BaeS
VVLAESDVASLGRGEVVSGVRRGQAYAAAPLDVDLPRAEQTAVVVLTEQVDAGLGPALRWFVAAAAVTLVVAAVVAATLGRRLTQSLRAAEAATRRIAAGDLSTRVPEPAPSADDEVAGLSRSINAMADALARSRGLEQQFLLSVSHDLRTPLTSIRGYAEAIADGAVEDEAAAAGVILTEARRLERLVHDLLDLARLEAHQFSFTLGPVDLGEVAAGTVDGFRPEAEEDGITLDVRAPGPGPVVHGDADRLAQVVANLVENAMKHARSRVVVEAPAGGGWATLAVSDDGPGIAAEDLPHVFERLYVARHEPRRRESGSGLGLAIVRELVTAMGGTVAAEPPVPGGPGGARLVVRLPTPS